MPFLQAITKVTSAESFIGLAIFFCGVMWDLDNGDRQSDSGSEMRQLDRYSNKLILTLAKLRSNSTKFRWETFFLKFCQDQASMLYNFFLLSLTTRPNKLEGLPSETHSSRVLVFEGKARANPIGGPFRCFLLVKLLVLPANVRLDWKVIAMYKHTSLFGLVLCNEEKSFKTLTPGGERGNFFSSSCSSTEQQHLPYPLISAIINTMM